MQLALDESFDNARVPRDFTQRIKTCAEDLARRWRSTIDDVLREHFPDSLERDQVMGPDDKLRLKWKPAVVLVEPPQGEGRLGFPDAGVAEPRRRTGADAPDTK